MIRYFHRSQFWTIFRIWQSERQPHHVVFSNINLVTLFLKSGIVFFFAIVVASLLLCVRTINKTETKQNKTENNKTKKASTWFELMPFQPSEFLSHILEANFVHSVEWLQGVFFPPLKRWKLGKGTFVVLLLRGIGESLKKDDHVKSYIIKFSWIKNKWLVRN